MEDVTITLGNNGIILKVSDNDGNHVGNLRIGQATVEWRQGRTRAGNGKRLKLSELIELFNGLP
jgi:hypothetical protein